jgi:hypothetical protein
MPGCHDTGEVVDRLNPLAHRVWSIWGKLVKVIEDE